MKNFIFAVIVAVLPSTVFAGYRTGDIQFPSQESLRKLSEIFLLNDGAMLHKCGFVAVQKVVKDLKPAQLRSEIKKIFTNERTDTVAVAYQEYDDYKQVPGIALLPGEPSGIDPYLVEDLLKLAGDYLEQWHREDQTKIKNTLFQGSTLFADDTAVDFFAAYSEVREELYVFSFDPSEESPNCR